MSPPDLKIPALTQWVFPDDEAESQKEGEQLLTRSGPMWTNFDLPDLSSQPLSVAEKCQLLELSRRFLLVLPDAGCPDERVRPNTGPPSRRLCPHQQPPSICGSDGLQGKCSELSPSTDARVAPAKMVASGDLETDGSSAVAEGGSSALHSLDVTDAPSCQCDRDEVNVTKTFPPSLSVVKVGEQYLTVRGQELCVTDSFQCGSVFQTTNAQGTRGGQGVFLVTLASCRGQGRPPLYLGVPPQCTEKGELPLVLEPFSSSPFIRQGERERINPDARHLVFTEVLDPDKNKFHLRPLDFPRMCVCFSQGKLVVLDEKPGSVIADFDFQPAGAQAVIDMGKTKKKKRAKRTRKVSQDSGFVTDSPTHRRPDRDPALASDDSLTSSSSADSLSSRPACYPLGNFFRGDAVSEGDASSSEGGATGAQTRRGRRRRSPEMCCTVS